MIARTFFSTIACFCVVCVGAFAQHGAEAPGWQAYGGDWGNTKYSPLDLINADNVGKLEVVWQWESPDAAISDANPRMSPFRFEGTPLHVDDTLYVSTGLSQVAAINARTGATKWVYDPESWKAGRPPNLGFIHRGVSYWTDGEEERIVYGTGDAHLISLDAKTGVPNPEFGDNGKVNLLASLRKQAPQRGYGVSSPVVILNGVVIVGSSISDGVTVKEAPPGDIRGFDLHTGELLWTFHSIPQEGEFGNETWLDGSWIYSGNTNVWTTMAADPDLGYVYLPFGTPTDDWYGGHRVGDNLFAESVVCLDANTGERVWHFQAIHHGVWDYDFPTAPNLVDIVVDGKAIKALAQVSKQGFCYVLDRETGEPVWPIEERAVPQSEVPGEVTSATQPHPTRPAPFERQGLGDENLIDYTSALFAEAQEMRSYYESGPLFTPPTERGTLNLPGWVGGANWPGAAVDPESGTIFIPSITVPIVSKLVAPDPTRSNLRYIGTPELVVAGPQGLPLVKGPYSRVTAIDLNSGEHLWMAPLGSGPVAHAALQNLNLGELGSGSRGYPMVTKSLLFVAQEAYLYSRDFDTGEPNPNAGLGDGRSTLRAFDKVTGDRVFEIALPYSPSANPMTYASGGKQYIVVGAGIGSTSRLIALAIPE